MRDLADDGTIQKRRQKLHHAGTAGDRSRRDITGSPDSDGRETDPATPTQGAPSAHGEATATASMRHGWASDPATTGRRLRAYRTEQLAELNGIRLSGVRPSVIYC